MVRALVLRQVAMGFLEPEGHKSARLFLRLLGFYGSNLAHVSICQVVNETTLDPFELPWRFQEPFIEPSHDGTSFSDMSHTVMDDYTEFSLRAEVETNFANQKY